MIFRIPKNAKFAIIALLGSSVISRGSVQILQCESHKLYSQCNAVKACTWCTGSAWPSGCYSNSFTKSFGLGKFKCVSMPERTIRTLTRGMNGERTAVFSPTPLFGDRTSSLGAMSEEQHTLPSQVGDSGSGTRAAASGENPPALLDLETWRKALPMLRRRTLGTVFVAGTLERIMGRSRAAPEAADSAVDSAKIEIATFEDGEKGTERPWQAKAFSQGLSNVKCAVSDGMLVFDGNVVIERTTTPGFVVCRSGGEMRSDLRERSEPFPDISSCEGISFVARSTTPFLYSLGFSSITNRRGYKTKFIAPLDEFGIVKIPFKEFTNFFSGETGDPVETCQENSNNCPDQDTLENLNSISFWGEGEVGKVHLEVKEINGYGCTVKDALKLSSFREKRATNCFCPLAVASVGLLVFLVVRIRKQASAIAPAWLG